MLVNNAGMSPLYPDLPSVTEELYDKVHAVNARGPFRLASLIGTRMVEGDGGSIINVSTAGSLRPDAHDLPYAMAKAGLNALTLGLAGAWAPKVRANVVMPGAFDTDITGVERRRRGAGGGDQPDGRIGQPDDLVGRLPVPGQRRVATSTARSSSSTAGSSGRCDAGTPCWSPTSSSGTLSRVATRWPRRGQGRRSSPPPSTTMLEPLMNAASGDTRKTTAPATSLGVPHPAEGHRGRRPGRRSPGRRRPASACSVSIIARGHEVDAHLRCPVDGQRSGSGSTGRPWPPRTTAAPGEGREALTDPMFTITPPVVLGLHDPVGRLADEERRRQVQGEDRGREPG